MDLSFDFGIYSLEYTHTWDGSVQVGVAEQLEQRGKLGLTGTHAPNLAFKSSFWQNIGGKGIPRERGTRVKSVDDRVCGLAGFCPELGWDVQDSSVNCGCNSRLAVPLMYTCVTENWVNWHRIEVLKEGLACTTGVLYIYLFHKQKAERPFTLGDDQYNTVPHDISDKGARLEWS